MCFPDLATEERNVEIGCVRFQYRLAADYYGLYVLKE